MSDNSTSRAALEIALAGAAEAGADTDVFDIRALDLPMYRPGHGSVPAVVHDLASAFHAADGIIWSSPMYHGTVSGSFKNALDWLQVLAGHEPPYLSDKPIGLISMAGGTHALQAINTMEFVVRALRGLAVPLVVPVARSGQAFPTGSPADPALEMQLRALGSEVARLAERMVHRPILANR